MSFSVFYYIKKLFIAFFYKRKLCNRIHVCLYALYIMIVFHFKLLLVIFVLKNPTEISRVKCLQSKRLLTIKNSISHILLSKIASHVQ